MKQRLHRTNLITNEYGKERKILTDDHGNLFYRMDGKLFGTYRSNCYDPTDDADIIRYTEKVTGRKWSF